MEVCGVTIKFVGNGHGDTSSNPDSGCFRFISC